jgi:hypothetical protein
VTRAIFAISALVVIAFASVIGPPEPELGLHAPLAIKDIIAFRRAVTHGAAVARNRQTERECAPIRQARYATLDRLFDATQLRPGVAFGDRYLGMELADDDDRTTTESYPLASNVDRYQIYASGNLGHVDELRAVVAIHSEDRCHARGDEAIECPSSCHEEPLEACDALHARLDRAWRHEATAIWRSEFEDIRATLVIEDSSCELVFERHVNTSSWISRSASAEIPIGLLGRPFGWLPRRPYPYRIEKVDRDTYEWQAAATGDHIRGMRVQVRVKHGIIVDVRATGVQSDEAVDELEAITRELPVTVVLDDDHSLVIAADASRVRGADR